MRQKEIKLSALAQSINNAEKSASAMLTLTALFNMAVMYSDDNSMARDKLPPLRDISALCDDLAFRMEDALCSVRLAFQEHERSLKQLKGMSQPG